MYSFRSKGINALKVMCFILHLLAHLLLSLPCFPLSVQFIPNYYKFYSNKEDEQSNGELTKFIARLEEIIKKNKDGFLGGETAVGATDYLLWPWFERIGAVTIIKPGMWHLLHVDNWC